MKRLICIVATMLVAYGALNAQKVSSKSTDGSPWRPVDSLIQKQYFTQAYDRAEALYVEALRAGMSRQSLVGARYLAEIGAQYREDNTDTSLARYWRLLPRLDAVDQAVCRYFLADFYSSYYSHNQWRILQNSPADEEPEDIALWDKGRMQRMVCQLLRDALSDKALLLSVSTDSVAELCTLFDGESGDVTPTLYDIMMDNVMTLYGRMDMPRLREQELASPGLLCAEAERFVAMPVRDGDDTTRDMARFLLRRIQDRERHHLALHSGDATLVYLYRQRVNNLMQLTFGLDDSVRMERVPEVVARFRKGGSESVTMLYYDLMELLYRNGRYEEAMRCADTAMALFPDSPGAARCYNLQQSILRKDVHLQLEAASPSGRPMLGRATVKNASHLYFRVIKYVDYERRRKAYDRQKEFLCSQPVLKQWDQAVGPYADYREHESYFTVPEMPRGKYLLLASPDPDCQKEGLAVAEFDVQDVALLPSSAYGSYRSGFVLERVSGKPVAGCRVTLQYGNEQSRKTLATRTTDGDGFYDFGETIEQLSDKVYSRNLYYTVHYKGDTATFLEGYTPRYGREDDDVEGRCFFFDRPIYKPGDTVRFAVLNYEQGRREGRTLQQSILFRLYDINYRSVDTLRLQSDAFGVCEGRFVLPGDAMPGYWSVSSESKSSSFRVEAYKQPKFTVRMTLSKQERRFGTTARVEGLAASYSAVPVGNAKVQYTVTRREKLPRWRWGWWNWYSNSVAKVVASGETATDGTGGFAVEFVPTPDSNSDLRRRPCYDYTVTATVTDLNGESHEASAMLSVGYESSYINIAKTEQGRDSVLLAVNRYNLDGDAIGGRLTVEVVRLQTPRHPKLTHQVVNGPLTLSRDEFERQFPLFDYDGSAKAYEQWPVAKRVQTVTVETTPQEDYRFDLQGREAGVYRLTATSVETGDTMRTEHYVIYEPLSAREPVRPDLITADIDNESVEVGDTARICIGSRYDDVTLYVVVGKAGKTLWHEVHRVDKGYTEIRIPVADTLLGGITVAVAAMKENHYEHLAFDVEVPHSHKQLRVEWETFRDKLQPGAGERWTLRINEQKTGLPAAANLLMTMYDHALDSYGGALHFAGAVRWPSSQYTRLCDRPLVGLEAGYYNYAPITASRPFRDYRYRYRWLKDCTWMAGYGRIMYNAVRMTKSADARLSGTARGESGVFLTEEAVEEEEVAFAVAGDGFSDGSTVDAMGTTNEPTADEAVQSERDLGGEEADGDRLQLRQNMSTLAFFMPTLRSGDDGRVELSFTVPDLLTEWSIEGLAWTRDLKVGCLSSRAVTQKRLMVVPNVPRFLRHGDTCHFSVKVSNMSDSEQDIAVTLTMSDAADGSPVAMVVGDTLKHIRLQQGTSGEVSFLLAVPREALFVAIYKVVARGQGCSDGEQAPIPLLPSRQMVTESMAFYINGAGEKHYALEHLAQLDTTAADCTLDPYSLTVELTPNPMWLALQSLPYVSRQENPSNIYLANSLYANSLSAKIVQENPTLQTLFREWEQGERDAFQSALDRNSDLKQTVMEETPWLRDAVAEEQRHRDVANFFNKSRIDAQLRTEMSRLLDAQRSDGGWSWIPDGRQSNLYTTQYILKTFGLMQQQGVEPDARTRRALDRAMDYVDRETYRYYKQYIKGHDFEPVNLDYLYVRSHYPNRLSKEQQEAYDFFYNNAKKYNESYRSLFTQSLLALVFHRHGDHKLAKEMTLRIREKALYGDETGMYWRDNTSGWCWNERPIETQALLIRTFAEVLGDSVSVAKMQQWLLKQKQTTNWSSDVATVNAIQALTVMTGRPTFKPSAMRLTYGSHELTTDTTRHQLHVSQRLSRGEYGPAEGRVTLRKAEGGIAWGAMYWQYFEQVDKVPASSMGITLKRTLLRAEKDGSLTTVTAGSRKLKVGDKVRVRIEIVADRNLEYLELKDPRCAGFEPVSTASGWRWNSGLSYYDAVTNTGQTLYIDRLDKGRYVVEYDLYVNNAGTFVTAPTTMQCLYAPEYRAVCPAEKVTVTE